MGIDAKETGAILWKILGFSMNTSIKFMRNHPIISGVSMFLLVLYIFLPSLLFFLIYTSPVFACVVVYAREKLGLRFSGSKAKSCEGEKKCRLKQQRSVRRNARMKVEKWDSSQTSDEEKDKVILTSLYNDLLGRTPQFEDSPKSIQEADVQVERNEKTFVVGGVVEEEEEEEESRTLSNNNLNGEEEEEETMVCCNCELEGKDQETSTNVNEIERNRRLESLIARRRARRLFKLALSQQKKLQAEETTTSSSSTQNNNNNNNLQVTVSRNKFEKHRNYSSEDTVMGVQIPGSAPSVMLQGRNPFDIPYDPQEERPNLTGDSFDEEFSLFNHQDMFFCRHESFCRFSLFSPQHAQCMNSPASASDFSNMKKRLDLENEYMDQIEEKVLSDEKDEERRVESGKSEEREVELTNEETDSNKEEGGDDDSSSSEESESDYSRLNNEELREAICHTMDNNYPGFVANQARNSIPSQLPRVAPRLDDNSMFYARRGGNSHGRTFSIASDMQVEVSEVGSPPTTVDWLDDWSNGAESYTYDTDIDREIVRGEESRKRLSEQTESRNDIGLKEENNVQSKEDVMKLAAEVFEQRPSSSSDMFKRSNSGKFGGSLFHTSVSLSSITEEPETVLVSIEGGNSENMNYLNEESTDRSSLSSLDSVMKKNLIEAEVVDVKPNDALCGSPKMIDLDQWNNIQGEDDTEINVNTEREKYEATQSLLDASLDSSYRKSFEREMEEEEEEDEPNLGNSIEEETEQPENEAVQSHVLTGLLESEVMEENGPKLVENVNEKAELIEQENAQIILNGSSSHPYTQLLEDDIDTEKGNSSTLDNSIDQEISKEGENSGLMQDLNAELTEEHNNRTSDEEESVVSTEIQNSQDSQSWTQQCGINSSEEISPRTLEATQQPEHEDVIVPNTVFPDIDKDESVTLVEDSASSNNNDEENLKLNDQTGEAMEKTLELDLEPMHHSSGLVAREDDENSKESVEVMHIAQGEVTKDDNRVSED